MHQGELSRAALKIIEAASQVNIVYVRLGRELDKAVDDFTRQPNEPYPEGVEDLLYDWSQNARELLLIHAAGHLVGRIGEHQGWSDEAQQHWAALNKAALEQEFVTAEWYQEIADLVRNIK
jgi:hypothetical protein